MTAKDDYLRLLAIDGLERHSRWLADSSERLIHYIKLLASRPDYPTRASEEIKDAQKRVGEALKVLNEMEIHYAEKPVKA